MAGKGLYANIHAKRKRGGRMKKKGAKGAPTAANFARAKQTARTEFRTSFRIDKTFLCRAKNYANCE